MASRAEQVASGEVACVTCGRTTKEHNDMLWLAGCTCERPLIGHRPPSMLPRCRLCNVEVHHV